MEPRHRPSPSSEGGAIEQVGLPPGEPAPSAVPVESKQVRAFWRAAIILNVAILLGLAVVFARMFYLAFQSRETPTAVAKSLTSDVRLPLPAGAEVRSVSLSGDRLAVQYSAGSAAGIAIIDLPTGKVLSNIEFVPR